MLSVTIVSLKWLFDLQGLLLFIQSNNEKVNTRCLSFLSKHKKNGSVQSMCLQLVGKSRMILSESVTFKVFQFECER